MKEVVLKLLEQVEGNIAFGDMSKVFHPELFTDYIFKRILYSKPLCI